MTTAFAHAPLTPRVQPWVRRFVRLGYAAKGIIYLLIGTLALQVALGAGGRLTDSSGVLKTLLRQPFGTLLIALIGAGILAYAGWEITRAVLAPGSRRRGARGWIDRSLSIIKGGAYGTIGVEAVRLVLGNRQASQNADDYARDAMHFPLGNVFLVLVGVGIAVYGLRQFWLACTSQFDDDLNQGQLIREGGAWVLNVGRVGIGARGVILTLVGTALLRAGLDRSPSKAAGMTEAMWTLFSQPFGQWLLALVAAGLACFGFFQLLHARYARL
jgi:hypothetical protein